MKQGNTKYRKNVKSNNDFTTFEKQKIVVNSNSELQIIDKIDLQLLIAVFVIFVSAWVYLKNIICDFTISTSLVTQIVHIIAHYILTIYMILCLFMCSVKCKYILNQSFCINTTTILCFEFFMKTWAFVLCTIFLSILTCGIPGAPWIILLISIIAFCLYLNKKIRISLFASVFIVCLIIFCFPIFLSTMTILVRPISLSIKQSDYNLDEYVTLFVNGKGYACKYWPVVLEDNFLYSGTEYIINYNTVSIPVTGIKNGVISVGVMGPINSFKSFICYPCCKLFNYYGDNVFVIENGNPYFYDITINVNP